MARRLAGVCCGLLLLLLSACTAASQEPSPPVTTGFSCRADIRYKDMELTGTLSRSTAGTLQLTFSAPDTLDGVTVEWQGDRVTASLYGLSFDLSPDTLPAGALGAALTGALDAVWRAPGEGTLTDQGWRWEGSGENGGVILLADPADGSLLSMEMPAIPLSVSFADFELTPT